MDLSSQHEPVSKLFSSPQSPGEWQGYALGREQVQSFEENGFLPGIKVLDPPQLEQLREALDKVVDPGHPGNSLFYEFHLNEAEDEGKVLFHALGAWQLEPALHDLPWAPALRMAACQLLGGAVRLFHDQLFIKPPEHGGVVAWHQDYSYWTWTRPMAHLSCWIPLDDADADNGCLQYIPGSHRWGLLPITGLTGEMDAAREVLDDSQCEALDRPFLAELAAGHGVFHHPLTLHGSAENRSENPRRAIVINMVLDGVRSNAELLSGKDTHNFPILPQGTELSGRYYPMLFSPDKELGEEKNGVPLVSDSMGQASEQE
ncbi:MAG: phytanoyl-CoA dioxygenase family protein [Planctomycetota bacterium]|nr:phytanoyl-CoA dioxygenase family protein [Planctomycetota bacterium]